LSFKPETDDIRESRAIPVITELLAGGAEVIAYDPIAMPEFSVLFPNILYTDTARGVFTAEAILINYRMARIFPAGLFRENCH
jgi:UDPglucose 6-dehydrogenase